MYVAIDTSKSDVLTLHYFIKARSHRRDFSLLGEGSLLASITTLLADIGEPLGAVKGITVVAGHGRWTAIRVAVVVANSLAYALNIPVMTVGSAYEIEQSFADLPAKPAGEYILPVYNGEARIGIMAKP